jgi:hypothetical protein
VPSRGARCQQEGAEFAAWYVAGNIERSDLPDGRVCGILVIRNASAVAGGAPRC